eukprot:TRINITY_DN94119_c0_g1_i1.p1 TRINITY_DN94119_c0_g1~~TRINITY_DN94119_c0_g1_i1.p1  ORF type:complete len:314 (-),score=69.63 TRINITY_DN94119_c0_g1_i1:116-1057(-)
MSSFLRILLLSLPLLGHVSSSCDPASSSFEEESCPWAFEEPEDDETELLEVTLLQSSLKMQRTAKVPGKEEKASQKLAETTQPVKQEEHEDNHVLSLDHNGRVCMLCNKPLPDRIGNRQYTEFRRDCGNRSSSTGPSAADMAVPAVELWKSGSNTNGFCELNFAKSCADAVANKDYLYWPKSIDLKHSSMRANVRWDGKYCQLNGFLQRDVVMLQHNFTAMRDRANELCQTKYTRHGIQGLTFLDMMEKSRHEDQASPSQKEAEEMAAWSCAMGDLGCDMAMCTYSFCDRGGNIGLYDECKGWDPVAGMPMEM